MLNRAGSLQLEHFNKSNALAWALTMGLFAMPVVYSDREWSQMVGESYYIQLAPGDKFGWTEPEGKVYQIAADNLTQLQEEIYRVCYLPQAGKALDKGTMQSGLAKQMDFSITQEVLLAYGDAVKDQMRRVLRAIADGQGGRPGDRRDGDGRVRHLRFFDGAGGREATAGAGDGLADAQERDLQETGVEISERFAAGRQGSDRGGDRRGFKFSIGEKDGGRDRGHSERDAGGDPGVREGGAEQSRARA